MDIRTPNTVSIMLLERGDLLDKYISQGIIDALTPVQYFSLVSVGSTHNVYWIMRRHHISRNWYILSASSFLNQNEPKKCLAMFPSISDEKVSILREYGVKI